MSMPTTYPEHTSGLDDDEDEDTDNDDDGRD